MVPAGGEVVQQLYSTLHRYAGWLDRERRSVIVRADVVALGAALDAREDPAPLLQALDIDLARLPGGDLRKMLRAAAVAIRRAVETQP